MIDRLRRRAQTLKRETYALFLAYRDPRTPWYARLITACVVAYAFSPIDLIPDFIPILGYLDDLILVPLGIALAIRLIPPIVLKECREQAHMITDHPTGKAAALVIVLIWISFALVGILWVVRLSEGI